MLKTTLLSVLAMIGTVQAHMQLAYPPPFNATNNIHRTTPPDTELDFPHNCCGKKTPFPCRGYLHLLGTPDGAPTASWPAGSAQYWAMAGPPPFGGNHYGGSCQIGFSVDQGKTFRVVTSYEGACPHRNGGITEEGQRYNFTVPSDLPSGDVLFAWTWYNREQEFFMNCAAVTITDGQKSVASGSSEPVPRSTIAAQSPSPIGSSIMTLSTQTMAKSSPAPASLSSSSSASASPSPAGTHEIHGCTCRCGSYTTRPDGSISVGKCSCSCPNTVNKRDLTELDNAVQLPSHHHAHVHTHTDGKAKRDNFIAFNSRPEMFYADNNNGCFTPKTTMELKYPNPGLDVVRGDGEYPLASPYGTCS